MGLPAVRHERPVPRTRRPNLRVVKGARPKVKCRGRSATAKAESARGAFRSFAILVTLVVALGMGRVWLSVQANEASTRSTELRSEIKNARYEGDMLEVRQSALGSPSRIRAIASQTMGMATASKVAMIDITPKPARVTAPQPGARTRSGVDSLIEGIMDVTAGEAQVLLVGDVGLVSSR